MKAPLLSLDLPQVPGKYVNELNKAKKKFLNTHGGGNETILQYRKKLINGHLIGRCKYCNPAWSYVSNFAEAVKGYDVPMGNPYPGTMRNIFELMKNKEIILLT